MYRVKLLHLLCLYLSYVSVSGITGKCTCINLLVIQQLIFQLTTFNKKGIKQQSLCGMNSPHVGGLPQLVYQWLGVSTVQLLSGLQYLNLAQIVQKFIHLENKKEYISTFIYKLIYTWHIFISFFCRKRALIRKKTSDSFYMQLVGI